MASRPEEVYSPISSGPRAFPASLEAAARYCPVQPYRIEQVPAQNKWPTGLKSDLQVDFTPDHRNEIPQGLLLFVEKLKKLERLPPNWDSYQAFPLDIRVERPALELALHSNVYCNYPSVAALPTGGVSLRWISGVSTLEIDISPSGTCEALLELGDGDIELPSGSTIGAAKALLNQFNRAS